MRALQAASGAVRTAVGKRGTGVGAEEESGIGRRRCFLPRSLSVWVWSMPVIRLRSGANCLECGLRGVLWKICHRCWCILAGRLRDCYAGEQIGTV